MPAPSIALSADGSIVLLGEPEDDGGLGAALVFTRPGGGDILARLNSDLFGKAGIADYGAAVAWDDDDLRIDAVHLEQLAQEQRPFGAKEASKWQRMMQLSNQEAAALLGIAVSTWNAYKAQGNIPSGVAMLCRAARRDPIMMHAHFRPRRAAGRPRRIA